MTGLLGLKRIRPYSLTYPNGLRYEGVHAREEWASLLAFATALTRFERVEDGHAVTLTVEGIDEPVSIVLRLS